MESWQRFTAEEAARKLNTDISLGRTSEKKRPPRKRRESVFLLPRADIRECVMSTMTDAAVMIFFITAVVSMLVGELRESAMALAVLLTACMIAGYMKFSSRIKLFRLAEKMLPTVNLLSEGNVRTADSRDISVGDVIILLRGDVVPADCRLIRSSHLKTIEYFTDVATAKRRARVLEKNANTVYGDSDERESYDNMIYAGSTIVSGKCKALVVAIGKDTRAAMIDSGIPLTPDEPMPPSVVAFSKRGRGFATAMLIAVLPITIIGTVCQPQDGLGIVSVFFLAVALSLTSFSEISASAAESIVLGSLSEIEDGARIAIASRSDALAQTDTLLILCESAVLDTERHIRRIFWNGADKRGSLTSGAMKPLAEKLDKLIAAAELMRANTPIADADAFSAYVKSMGISRKWNISEGKSSTPRIDFPSVGAFSAVVIDEKTAPVSKEIISCAQNAALIRNCRKYRSSKGDIKPLDQPTALKAVAEFNKYRSLGLSPYTIASTVSSSEGMVFEGIIAVGIAVPEHNKASVDALRSVGVRPIFIMPEENEESVFAAQSCGIADPSFADGGIAIASQFPDSANMEQLVASCSVFVGFGKKGTAEISRVLAEKGAKSAAIVLDSFDLRDVAPNTSAISIDGESPDSARLSASAAVRSADRNNKKSGFGMFFAIVSATRNAKARLKACGEYFTTCAAFRAVFALLPVVSGLPTAVPSVPLILLTGLFGDIAAVCVLAGAANAPTPRYNVPQTNEKTDVISRLLSVCGGLFVGSAASGIGMILAANGVLWTESYASYALPTVCFVQLSVLGVSLYKSRAKVFGTPFVVYAIVNSLVCVIPYTIAYFTAPSAMLSLISIFFGLASAHKLVMLCAPVSALFTAAVLLFAQKLISGAVKSGFIKDQA